MTNPNEGPVAQLALEVAERPRLSAAELQELVEIEKSCFPPRTRYSRLMLLRFLLWRGSLLVRGRVEGRLAGFQLSNWQAGHLITLDVRPEFRRQGVGERILRRTLEEFRQRGLSAARCEIAVENAASIALHRKLGFEPLGIIHGYYEDGGDALVMEVDLGAVSPEGSKE